MHFWVKMGGVEIRYDGRPLGNSVTPERCVSESGSWWCTWDKVDDPGDLQHDGIYDLCRLTSVYPPDLAGGRSHTQRLKGRAAVSGLPDETSHRAEPNS